LSVTIRFGLVGCGVISGPHVLAIQQLPGEAELTAVTDTVLDSAKRLAKEVGEAGGGTVQVAADLDELLARDDVDALAVCVPSGAHEEIAVRALRAGKHVLVEKPLALTVASVDRIIAARDAAGRTAGVISQNRYAPGPDLLREAVAAGRLGTLTSGSAAVNWYRSQGYYDSAGWRGTWEMDGGGALMNQGIHYLDLLCWMFGEPEEVYAHAGLLAHQRMEVEDSVTATVRFTSGASATLLATTAAYPGLTARLHVHGSRGSAVVDNNRLEYFHAAPEGEDPDGPTYGASGAGNQAEAEIAARAARRGGDELPSHTLQLRDFVRAASAGRQPAITLEDGRRAVALIRAVYDSADTGAPVRLSS
jgi:predicted dehydrogenase